MAQVQFEQPGTDEKDSTPQPRTPNAGKRERTSTVSSGTATPALDRLATYGPLDAITFVDPMQMEKCVHRCTSELLQRPRIFQYLENGRLHRSRTFRETSRFELFLDLLLVGVVRQLSESAVEEVSFRSAVRFILAFFPCWSIWSDMRSFLNSSGVDDIPQRIYMLMIMILLLGYSANASAIELPSGGHSEPVASEAVEAVLRIRAVVEVGSSEVEHIGPQSDALTAAIAFFLVAKLLRMILYAIYAWALPHFAYALMTPVLTALVTSVFFIAAIWAPSWTVLIILLVVALVFDMASRYYVGLFRYLWDTPKSKSSPSEQEQASSTIVSQPPRLLRNRFSRVPALNIEHFIERGGAFLTVILGEMVVNVLYHANDGSIGLSPTFGRACFGLIVAFCANWAYFSTDLANVAIHALRRHWFTGLTFTNLHFPLYAALLLASGALGQMVKQEHSSQGLRWYFGSGLAVATVSMTALSVLHKSLDPKNSTRLSRNARILARGSISIVFACMPLATSLSNLKFLSIYACVAILVVAGDTYGRLTRPSHYLQQQRKDEEQEDDDDDDIVINEGEGGEGVVRRSTEGGSRHRQNVVSEGTQT